MARAAVIACLAALVLAAPARAQPGLAPASVASTSDTLRGANAAALAGDWPRVIQLVGPLLLAAELAPAELGEAHRLAGIAVFFEQRREAAESHFLAYLRLDPDARLDPALYPPDVVAFFNDVASRHAAELRALRRPFRHYFSLNFLPPAGQFQNGDSTKGWVLGGLLASMLATNVTTFAVLHAWCDQTSGPAGKGLDCNDGRHDHNAAASVLRPINLVSGIAFVAVYVYGVYDGVRGYRQKSREHAIQPYVATTLDRKLFGIQASF